MRIDAFITTRPSPSRDRRSLYEANVWRLTRPRLAVGDYPQEHVWVGRFYGRTEHFAFKSAERYALREFGRVVSDPLAPHDGVRYARSVTISRERGAT